MEKIISLKVTAFEGVTPSETVEVPTQGMDASFDIKVQESEWKVDFRLDPCVDKEGSYEGKAIFSIVSGSLKNANVSVCIKSARWSQDNYVFMPAAVYDGNRFRVIQKDYPPMLQAEDGRGVHMPVTITDVPHLKKGASGKLHLRSGDMATPCIGFQSPLDSEGFLMLGDHNTPFGYIGFVLEEGPDGRHADISLEVPAVRQTRYLWGSSEAPSDDKGFDFRVGDRVELRFRLYAFDCPDIPTLYSWYCSTRGDLSGEPLLEHGLPFSDAFRIIEDKYIESQWNEEQGHLMVAPHGGGKFGDWQAGWVGGGMNSLAFLSDGQEISKMRSRQTMDNIFGHLQAPTGFIYPIMAQGLLLGDDFDHQEDINILLIRKNADMLLFAARHILLLKKRNEEIPKEWIEGFRKLANAFLRLWDRYGQFGQFIDIEKEEILIGETASGSTSPGGLALAFVILEDMKYLETAINSGQYYYEMYVRKGLTNGGPGEILQGPDSESAFGLLESYIALYESTGDEKWLPMAEACAQQCASWCVSYDFDFPPNTVFGSLDMKTTGSVYANVQNKHSAPGICTLSGVSLLKLYRATGNRFYLNLCQQVTHNITQYLSRPDRLIPTWDEKLLPSGWMCERVNMCDWETKDKIGGVFYGSCWCEVSALLTFMEVPGVWFLSDTGEAIAFDHVDVSVSDLGDRWVLEIENPTLFDAEVKILIETHAGFSRPLGECPLEGCPKIKVPTKGVIQMVITKEKLM